MQRDDGTISRLQLINFAPLPFISILYLTLLEPTAHLFFFPCRPSPLASFTCA
ncbi:hypothetical protein BCR43DRAFT_366348 [Syncephalastrum racemosum]|uniref:Uncharacterized protein n=1 Tax=Syncephalastrum racemosum TaxID=13706 RepID=A0A1X2H415_SYNRA|nr:hypothetical protein BCR43DRAFT_366348 [Syncephalastrum racemosum]